MSNNNELKNTNYELFILVLSLLSIINWIFYFVLTDRDVLLVITAVDLLISLIFLLDFLYRLWTADSKPGYFVKQLGWLDLLSSLPFPQLKIMRLARIIRAIILLRRLGTKRVMREFIKLRAESAVYIVAFLIILVLEFGSAAVLTAEEGAPGANIETAGEAIWWSIVTMSTIGYGDYVPVTPEGRIIGLFVIIVGVALFGVVTGFLANRFVGSGSQTPEAPQPSAASHELAAVLDELAALRAEQKNAYSELERKVDGLQRLLQDNSSINP